MHRKYLTVLTTSLRQKFEYRFNTVIGIISRYPKDIFSGLLANLFMYFLPIFKGKQIRTSIFKSSDGFQLLS
jgi:ABC-type uncharacterized transport system permease subunit